MEIPGLIRTFVKKYASQNKKEIHGIAKGKAALSWVGHWNYPAYSEALGEDLGVATQGDFTCVEQGNGTVQCFGLGTDGQLGNGMFANASAPQTVGNGMQLRGVSTG